MSSAASAATTTTTTALAATLSCRLRPISPFFLSALPAFPPASRRSISCHAQIADSTEVASSSSGAEKGSDPESKVGARVRVKVPLKVYHVMKAPELDLNGMEGVVKQYVGVWKGKLISANLPFKVEFLLPIEGQGKPVKFFAHLKDDEFEFLPSD